MVKPLISSILIFILISLTAPYSVYAHASRDEKAQFANRVKENILKLGSGPSAIIEVKLRDKRKLKGYIAEVGDESFVVVDAVTQIPTTIAYPQVKQVKGHNLSSGAKIAIGVGIAVGVLVILAVIFKDHIVAY